MPPTLSLADFIVSPPGRRIAPILNDPEVVESMISLSVRNQPAVLAIDARLPHEIELDDTQKRHVGRWIRDILAERGWSPRKRLHFRNGRVFSSGAVYGRHASPPTREISAEVAARVSRVREMVRGFSTTDYGSADLIADRRKDAARER